MGLDLIPAELQARYTFEEREHAISILARDFPDEFKDICDCLNGFVIRRQYITQRGGRKSLTSIAIDTFLHDRGWREKEFDIKITVDRRDINIPTHKIDNFKNRVGIETEWNNKDPFFDRDLNNFRLLRDLHVLSVGVIITRLDELQTVFKRLGRAKSYGASTTHWGKLIPKVNGGGAGGCPLLLIGMGFRCLEPNL
jgi:hypothetical protein